MDVFKKILSVISKTAFVAAVCNFSANAQSLIRDAEIETTLKEYAAPLFIAGGLQPNEVEIHIVNDNSLNAFVSGGKHMFFHTGLLIKAENPQEILGVMAHETGHILGGHNISRMNAMKSAQGSSWIALGLGVLAIAAGAPDAGAALMASSQQAAMLTFFKYTRIEESTADQIGLSLLEKTQTPADGLVTFMEKIRVSEVLSAQRQDPYYRTHPEVGTRIGALRPRAEVINAQSTPLPEWYQTSLEMMQAKLIGFLQPRATYSKYPLSDTSIPARYARAIAAHQNHDQTAALNETNELIQLEPDNPYFYELLGQIYYENGKIEDSVAPHRKALELNPNHSLLYVNLAQSLIGLKTSESATEAEELLHQALIRERGNAYAWLQMSYALGFLGRKAEAELATAESAYAIGDYQRASMFAHRALEGLPRDTPKWRRADDIFAVTEAQVRMDTRGGQGRFSFESNVHAHVTSE